MRSGRRTFATLPNAVVATAASEFRHAQIKAFRAQIKAFHAHIASSSRVSTPNRLICE